MSLRRIVTDMILERGTGTVDDLMPRLAGLGYTRDQAIKALHNAKSLGFLACDGAKPKRGVRPDEMRPAIYGPPKPQAGKLFAQLVKKKEERIFVSSVFQLGNPLPESDWPKGWIGQVHRPLGEWNSADEAH